MIRRKAMVLASLLVPLAVGIGKILDLWGLKPTFTEDFNDLKVSDWNGDNRWIAHTPWSGDFGAAAFANPQPDLPFTERILRTVSGHFS